MPGWKHAKATRQERGYGQAWLNARSAALARDFALCQPCRAAGRDTPATEVDHITPKSKGGTDALDNLQSICTECHTAKTQAEAAEAQGRKLRPRVTFDRNGFPVWPEGR